MDLYCEKKGYIFKEGGDNGLFIALVPKVFNNVFLFVGLTTLGFLIGWLIQTFQRLILIDVKGKFVYENFGCTSIYRSLSYPFRSLIYITFFLLLPLPHYKAYIIAYLNQSYNNNQGTKWIRQ